MRDTRFNSRNSDWLGSLTQWRRENAEDNSLQLERLRRSLHKARETELTPRQQQVLTLYYEEKHTLCEIAALLEIHPSTVCRTLQRARHRLQRALRYTL